MNDAELAGALREHAYLEGDFVLRSGRRSRYYLDKYRFETRPDLLASLGDRIAGAVREHEPEATLLAGPELGAVALAAAAGPEATRPFDAVAGFSTGAFGPELAEAAMLPPTILLSAGRTDAIPLSATLPLYRALRRAGVPSELYVYPRGSHDWPKRQGALGIEHAAAFLRRYLR